MPFPLLQARRCTPERLIDLVLQYLKFGVVGLAATATHVLVFVALIEEVQATPLVANVLAFCVAVFVSYFGNFRWTFRHEAPTTATFVRFACVSLVGLGLNSAVVYAVMDVAGRSYVVAVVVMVTLVPLVVFALNRLWSFKS